MADKINYSISWKYICDELSRVYGIQPDSDELFSMDELQLYIDETYQYWVMKQNRVDYINRHYKGKCAHCEHYDGVHDTHGVGLCKKQNDMRIWNHSCDNYSNFEKEHSK